MEDDFNMAPKRGERSGGSFSSKLAVEFKTTLVSLDLVDLPLMRGKWTWTNQCSNPSCSRIDRFLVSDDQMIFCFILQVYVKKELTEFDT